MLLNALQFLFVSAAAAVSQLDKTTNATSLYANSTAPLSLSTSVLQPFNIGATAANGSKIIIAGGGVAGTTGSGDITLNQCNTQCSSVNVVLFQTCASHEDIFSDQMRCSCSTVFVASVTECSSCCSSLGYMSEYQELVQVMSACQTIQDTGNSTDGAATLSYTTVTDYQTATLIDSQTLTVQPTIITSVYPVVSTIYYTIGPSISTYTVMSTHETTIYTASIPAIVETTSTPIVATIISSNTSSTHNVPVVTTTTGALPTVSTTSGASDLLQVRTYFLSIITLLVVGLVFV